MNAHSSEPSTTSTDPVPVAVELDEVSELLSRSRDRWRQTALAFIVLSALLLALSSVQIWGTYASTKLVRETQDEVERFHAQTAENLKKMEDLRATMKILASKQERASERQEKASERHERELKESRDWLVEEEGRLNKLAEHLSKQRRQIEEFNRHMLFVPPVYRTHQIPGHAADLRCPSGLKKAVDLLDEIDRID